MFKTFLESAKEMVNKMIKGGFVPDIQTFNTLVGAITKSGEVGFCIEMYYTTCKIGFCVDIDTYKTLIQRRQNQNSMGSKSYIYKIIRDFTINVGVQPLQMNQLFNIY